mgnify:CR=1 FL=1
MIKGLVASMLGAFVGAQSTFVIHGRPEPKKANKSSSEKGWRPSEPSAYFGQRSKIIVAHTKNGLQKMKLKSALKANLKFDFI